jgi:hypothetical protein
MGRVARRRVIHASGTLVLNRPSELAVTLLNRSDRGHAPMTIFKKTDGKPGPQSGPFAWSKMEQGGLYCTDVAVQVIELRVRCG